MKQMNTYIYSILAFTLSLTLATNGYGQGKSIEKTYHWACQVNRDVAFAFNNYDCDLVIHTWDKAEISYAMTVDAGLKSEEDARRLDGYIEKLEFSHSAGNVQFDSRFWTSKKAVAGRKTMTLKGEKTIRFSEFKMKGELWIPEDCHLHLSSKYSDIDVEELNGRLILDLYNDKLFGGNVNSDITVSAKYTTLEFADMKDIQADLYNTTFEAGDIGNLRIVSKYSRFKAGDAAAVDIDAYNDKYALGKTGNIKFTDKYSDLIAEQTGHAEMDCYNSTVAIARLEDMDLKSKYGSYEFEKLGNLHLISAYSDKFSIDSLKVWNVLDSKYCVYKIDHLERSLVLKEGYSDKLLVAHTGQLKEVRVNGKYVGLEMAINKETSYSFKADVTYPGFDINEEAMNVKIKIKEGSELKMEAVKGMEKEGMLSFFVNGYEMAITISEQ